MIQGPGSQAPVVTIWQLYMWRVSDGVHQTVRVTATVSPSIIISWQSFLSYIIFCLVFQHHFNKTRYRDLPFSIPSPPLTYDQNRFKIHQCLMVSPLTWICYFQKQSCRCFLFVTIGSCSLRSTETALCPCPNVGRPITRCWNPKQMAEEYL